MKEFKELYENNYSFIFKFLLKLCGSNELADELTQETFFRAFMNIAALRDREKASAWLCSIAKNAFRAHMNSHKRLRPLEDAAHLSDGENIAASYAEREIAAEAFRILEALEEPYRDVFKLAVFGDVSFKDISALYGKSESWARVTYYRAKQKIMERMGVK